VTKGGKRVALVVEGIGELARLITDALTQHNIACRVVLKNDGLEALDYLLGRGAYKGRDLHVMPCVTLLDLSLPRLDGLGLLREIRAHEQTRLLPVVAFSSADERQENDVVYGSGANSYIGTRAGFGPFEDAIQQVAHYWCVLNEPPPALYSRIPFGYPLWP
jgi:two-component system response regulator